jgi:AcrR family transcriptional regulator
MNRLKADDRRTQLMAVASRLFAERGFDATTTASIATSAAISEPILYRHFPSKLALFSAIVSHHSEQLIARWEHLLANIDDPADQIRAIAGAAPDQTMSGIEGYRVLHGALLTCRDPEVTEVVRQHYLKVQAYFASIIREGQRRGVFAHAEVEQNAWQLVMMGTGFILLGANLPGIMPTFEPHKMVEHTMRMLGWTGKK